MELSLLPARVGGVDYLYKVSHLSISTNSATRHLALYSLSSSVKLKKLEILLCLIVHLKSTGLHLLSGHQEAGHRSHSISLLCLLQIYQVRESPWCESFTIYIEEPHTSPKKPGIRTCSQVGIVWIGVPASLDLDAQLQHQDKCLQNKWVTCWIYSLHSGAEQLSVGLYKYSAQRTWHHCTTVTWYFLESMNNWFILPQMLIRTNTILNTCMTAAYDYLSKKLLPHYSTCLSNKVPNWICPKPVRRDTWGTWGVEERASKKVCLMHLSK